MQTSVYYSRIKDISRVTKIFFCLTWKMRRETFQCHVLSIIQNIFWAPFARRKKITSKPRHSSCLQHTVTESKTLLKSRGTTSISFFFLNTLLTAYFQTSSCLQVADQNSLVAQLLEIKEISVPHRAWEKALFSKNNFFMQIEKFQEQTLTGHHFENKLV